MTIFYSATFGRQYRKLAAELKNHVVTKERIFRANPFDSRLRTHKLHGQFDGLFSFSVNAKCRIIFGFEGDEKSAVRFHAIGTHDIYEH